MEWLSPVMIMIYVVLFGVVAAVLVAWADIFLKVGYSRWYCFLMVIPVVNIIWLFIFAWRKWPIHDYVEIHWDIEKTRKELDEKFKKEWQNLQRQIDNLEAGKIDKLEVGKIDELEAGKIDDVEVVKSKKP